ncbi:uncharacterized protein LOC131242445 isoform X3 [Magnolia sinica]|uniref:uncharacterized protein LOC131242445 isoform X3 n=1 Tax=Magnolia sinica TaxID=86752 RepID=UPI00265855A0|nr:uncharacterized protein LOC131242445 isoform X3 [Magnolia sinica]
MAEQLAMVSHLTDFEHLSLPCISLFSARTARGARRDFYRECPFGCKRDGTLMLDVFCHRLTAQKAGLRPLMNSSVACNSHRTSIQGKSLTNRAHFTCPTMCKWASSHTSTWMRSFAWIINVNNLFCVIHP